MSDKINVTDNDEDELAKKQPYEFSGRIKKETWGLLLFLD